MWCRNKILVVLLFFASMPLAAKQVRVSITPTATTKYYPVSISLEQFEASERALLGVWYKGKEIASQIDDLNRDGVLDEIAFQVPAKVGKRVRVTIKPSNKHRIFPKEVHAQMYLKGKGEGFTTITAEGKTYGVKSLTEQTFGPEDKSFKLMHHHGVAFESDVMAYRLYFDKRQTVDVYAKKTPQLELAECLWYPNDSLLAEGYGDDVLKVGNSIGVGSVRTWNSKKNKLNNIDKFSTKTQRIVANGPVRTVCEIEVKDWQTEGKTVDMTVRYTLYAHHRDVMCEVFLSEPLETLVTGVQKVGNGLNYHAYSRNTYNGQVNGAWGTDWPVNDTVKYAKETIGLGVYVPAPYWKRWFKVDKGTSAGYILFKPATYLRFYLTVVSQKENNPPMRTPIEFWDYLDKWAEDLTEKKEE